MPALSRACLWLWLRFWNMKRTMSSFLLSITLPWRPRYSCEAPSSPHFTSLRIESKQPCLIPDTIDSSGRSIMTVFEGGRHIRTPILHRVFNQGTASSTLASYLLVDCPFFWLGTKLTCSSSEAAALAAPCRAGYLLRDEYKFHNETSNLKPPTLLSWDTAHTRT